MLRQVRAAWNADQVELTRLAKELNQVGLVRAALMQTPEDAGVFEELLTKQSAEPPEGRRSLHQGSTAAGCSSTARMPPP